MIKYFTLVISISNLACQGTETEIKQQRCEFIEKQGILSMALDSGYYLANDWFDSYFNQILHWYNLENEAISYDEELIRVFINFPSCSDMAYMISLKKLASSDEVEVNYRDVLFYDDEVPFNESALVREIKNNNTFDFVFDTLMYCINNLSINDKKLIAQDTYFPRCDIFYIEKITRTEYLRYYGYNFKATSSDKVQLIKLFSWIHNILHIRGEIQLNGFIDQMK